MTLRELGRRWDLFLREPVDLMVFARLRICFGLVMLAYCATMAPTLELWYSEHGMVPYWASKWAIDARTWTLFSILPKTDWALWSMYGVLVASSICLLVGFRSRTQSLVVYLLLTTFHHRNNIINDGQDGLFRLVAFMMVFMPIGGVFSVDERMRKRTPQLGISRQVGPGWALRTLQISICLFMFSAGCWKLEGADWVDGNALYYVSRLPDFFGRLPGPHFLFGIMPLVRVMTWSVMAVELLVPIFIWFKETRRVCLILVLAFHLATDYSMNLLFFHWVLITVWMSFATGEDIQAVRVWVRNHLPKISNKRTSAVPVRSEAYLKSSLRR